MISMPFLLTGFSLGLAGSLHCVGMCGPLALALPLQSLSPVSRAVAIVLYNTGRIISYALLGLVTGIIGLQVALAGYQQTFSIVVGCILLMYLILSLSKKILTGRSPVYRKVQAIIIRYMQRPSLRNMLLVGIGNGLLPCGMVYLAIAASAVSGDITASTGFMLFFGLGTIPLMSLVSVTGLYVQPPVRNALRKVSPYITACIAVLLIFRGLNLDIPYISPLLYPERDVISCH